MMLCERCFKECIGKIMSQFNTQDICLECTEAEKKHPMYDYALQAELEAMQHGDYNFPGIGLPADYGKE